jgi:hypothetical protein
MIKIPDKESLAAAQRWQRALAHWPNLGFHSKVYHLAAHLQDEARKAGTPMDGATAFLIARDKIEAEYEPLLAENAR